MIRTILLLGMVGAVSFTGSCASRSVMIDGVVSTEVPLVQGAPSWHAIHSGLRPTNPESIQLSVASERSIEGRYEIWTPDREDVYPYRSFEPPRRFVSPDALASRIGATQDDLATFARYGMQKGGGSVGAVIPGNYVHLGTLESYIYSAAPQYRLITEIRDVAAIGVEYGSPTDFLLERVEEVLEQMRVMAARQGADRLVGITLSVGKRANGMRMYAHAVADDLGAPPGY